MSRLALLALSAAGLVVAGLAVGVAVVASSGGDRFAQCRGSQVAGGDLGGDFTLVNGAGETVTDEEVLTGPSLVYFGYTYCPDVCPLDAARNAEAVDRLAERGHEVTPVFISVDPARDTPEVVGNFADNLHPRMVGLTGSAEQVAQAAQAYRVYYQSHDDGSDDFYVVDHSTFTYLVLPGHGFVDFFRRELGPGELADRVACYLKAA